MGSRLTPARWRYLRRLGLTRRELVAGYRGRFLGRWWCSWLGHSVGRWVWNGGNVGRVCGRCGRLYDTRWHMGRARSSPD